ncbi:CUE domain-containing protein 2 isoform X2 [Chiloscyllium plagiosum]|uniref:CUE domain-containing protein 2 isoform X2 n=1 Tax=Chiloscyllium plagiosum TaxID=36176 RepID=UPI001CB829C0|nr:CUE domain-containing protein 2 isoform X2 [Chiloscyllium plagiosum]
MALEKIIQDALTQFVQLHIPDADLSVMDEVILSYITSVLEELGSPDSSEENFDVEMFVEMMAAYVPGFAEISSVTICEMMFDLAARLVEARNKENVHPLTASQDRESFSTELASSKEDKKSSEPESNPVPREGASAKETLPKADKKIKASILEKYMMVDNEDDVKTHKPTAPKAAPKKLIRYIDNQVVSTKGERYTEVKKTESEEMKKTYINLKPARKYKFH